MTTGGFQNEELDAALIEQGIEPSEHARQLLATAMLQRGVDPREPVTESLPASLSEPTNEAQKELDRAVHGFSAEDVTGKRIDPASLSHGMSASELVEDEAQSLPSPAEHSDPLVQALEDQGVRMSAFDLPPAQPYVEDDGDEEETPPEPPPPPPGELPGEVLAIWGVSEESLATARQLIAGWGLERFLGSELHRQAKYEATREARMNPIRAAFVKAAADKDKEKGRKR